MVACKNITKIIYVIVAAAVMLCILAMIFPERVIETFGGAAVALQYETELFDTDEIIQIDIQMDEEEWEDMLAHASEEAYYSCDMVINNTKLYNVGIRPKGNTSLSSIVMDPDTDRFSLKIEFDHYVEGQTCFGLDKLILNNNFADATNMKEALVYDMYQYLETDASLYNYAKICVNGQYWGVYLALEAVEDSFLLRNYGAAGEQLYKPESMGMGGGPGREGEGGQKPPDGGNGGLPGGRNPREADGREEENGAKEQGDPSGGAQLSDGEGWAPPDREERRDRGRMPGGPSMGGNGADLNYTDDELDSYFTIWEGEVTDSGKSDHRRVVTALKNIKEGTDPEKYMDVDNLLKYMAVHVFSVNLDSLSGVMAHNYYLYEHNGQLNILPWDYNLSFGGMGMGADSGASGVINDAIDTPFQATEFFNVLLENEEYLARYHEYLRQLVQEYVFGGTLEAFYNRVRNQIDTLVKTDPTAFYSFEEYEAAAEMLYKTATLRAESIQGQLDGDIPSTDEGQKADSSNLIDASSIDIDAMGVFGGGRSNGGGDRFGNPERGGDPYGNQKPDSESAAEVFRSEAKMPETEHGFSDMPGPQGMPQGAAWGSDASDRGAPQITGSGKNMIPNMIICGACLLAAVLALLLAKHYQRVKQ